VILLSSNSKAQRLEDSNKILEVCVTMGFSTEGIADMSTAKELRCEREQRITDAINLRITDRVPVVCELGFFAAKCAGEPLPVFSLKATLLRDWSICWNFQKEKFLPAWIRQIFSRQRKF
jgi:hypothetical protein